jgi:hypothetical protein
VFFNSVNGGWLFNSVNADALEFCSLKHHTIKVSKRKRNIHFYLGCTILWPFITGVKITINNKLLTKEA